MGNGLDPQVGDRNTLGLPQPEAGSTIVEGIAVGRAVVWAEDPKPYPVAGTVGQERRRLVRALARATSGVEELVRLLPRPEAELFEPEVAMLTELGPPLLAAVDAGARPEVAVIEATSRVSTDLLADARARLLDGLAYDERSVESLLEKREGDRILVASTLLPSVVAALPARVVGIVAGFGDAEVATGYTSHAAILARARDIPLALVSPGVVGAACNDDVIVLDATASAASVWIGPGATVLSDVQSRKNAWARARAETERNAAAPLGHLGIEVHVNIGSLYEHVPSVAEGIGLVRTELVFANRWSSPSEAEQFAVFCAIAGCMPNAPTVVRLFDAGGDKPIPWLRSDAKASARGVELLFMNPEVLDTQLRAIGRTAARANVSALIPLVRSASDVEQIRARAHRQMQVGALIETPEAVGKIDEIARVSDFVSIGTNDLFASLTGRGRVDSALSPDRAVLRMIEKVIAVSHACARKVSVCGEMAGDSHCARILIGLGVDALSVSTGRFAKVKMSLRDLSLQDCREVASEALRDPAY
jgi:phosphocarrier protein FPr